MGGPKSVPSGIGTAPHLVQPLAGISRLEVRTAADRYGMTPRKEGPPIGGPFRLFLKRTAALRLNKVETVQVHHLGPSGDEVVDELLLGVG